MSIINITRSAGIEETTAEMDRRGRVISGEAVTVTDALVKRAATEYLSHKGERPYRVTRRGAELWEDYAPAIRAALEAALSTLPAAPQGWQPIGEDEPAPPHDVPVLLWSPPTLGHPEGQYEARPFSTGRSGPGWSEYSQHSWATHWMPIPAGPEAGRRALSERGGEDGPS